VDQAGLWIWVWVNRASPGSKRESSVASLVYPALRRRGTDEDTSRSIGAGVVGNQGGTSDGSLP
jgi:hypothetical protein